MDRKLAALLAAALLSAVPAAAASSFDDPASNDTSQQFSTDGNVQREDTPDDPDYDRAEDPENSTTNMYDERFDLFGFVSKHTPLAVYLEGPNVTQRMIAGYNAAGAWKVERGRGEVFVAILDTGIRWNNTGLRTQVRLNADELPPPQKANGQEDPGAGLDGYDLNANGVIDVDDYASDPRLAKPAPTGQDLIGEFSDGTDADGNGYVDDIAGWDFFDDDNDPNDSSSYFASANHGTGRAEEVAERGNDGQGSIGVCPKCQFVPLRVWDTFVSDQTTFALGVIYGTDLGASVIEGADGGLYHSAFSERASEYAYQHGAVQVYSGDDLNTGNHNYPGNYSHTMLIQGTVADTYGLGEDAGNEVAQQMAGLPVGTELPVRTLFRGAGTTQYGGHSSISMIGATGSENTGKAAGAAALVVSAALGHDPPIHLKPDETRAILEQTAEDVTPLNTIGAGFQDRAVVGWDPHFGWGRVNLGEAVRVARSGAIPPVAAIHSPDWFAPLRGDSVHITGLAQAPRTDDGAFHWRLEWGAGQTPTSWAVAAEGDSTGSVTDFGHIDLAAVRAAVDAATHPADPGEPLFDPLGPTPYDREWTVRVVVEADGVDTPGIDRRVLVALDDDTLRPAFPKRMGTGGEGPLRYADLDGDGIQELVAPLQDGVIHAYRPDGTELPGWPVKTDLLKQAAAHLTAPGVAEVNAQAPPREPPRAPLIADLDSDGALEVATTAGRHVYVWELDGSRRPGFPVGIDPDNCRPEDQRQEDRHRKCGFLAAPALAFLDGRDEPPAIVAPALDGHLYAFRPDGSAQPGYPVELLDPGVAPAEQMHAESVNEPAVGDLNGDGRDDIVVGTNETYGSPPPNGDDIGGLIAQGISELLAGAAGGAANVYAVNGATGEYLPGWPIAVPGAIQTTLPLVGPGHNPALTEVDGAPAVVVSATGSGGIEVHAVDGSLIRTMQQELYGPDSNAVDRSAQLNLFESAVVGDITGNGTLSVVKYGVNVTQAANLLLVGQNVPYHHLIGAYKLADGRPAAAWPRITDDYQFLSSSNIAKVDLASPASQVIAGTGLGLLHAYDELTGLDAPGFPKVTGGWLYSPAALSDDGRIAGITREGYLFEWSTKDGDGNFVECQPPAQWPSFRHDQQGSGNQRRDGTPPGAPLDLAIVPLGGGVWRITFTAPGDDGRCGVAERYAATAGGEDIDLGDPVEPGTVVTRDVVLPGVQGELKIMAFDEAGNPGIAAKRPYTVSGGGGDPPPGATPTPTPTPTASPGGTPAGGGSGPGGAGNGTTPGGSSGCTDTLAPRSRFTRRAVRATRKGITLRGRSADRGCNGRLARVFVAVQRALRDGRCRSLRADLTFREPRSCHRTVYLRARGRGSWRVRLKLPLLPGRYKAWVRGVDANGNIERKHQPRNIIRFSVR